ncbi:hypothetical protein PS645_03704 [Pseudomonas fluorescens]|uniref:Uncharacterized protein n=1 Tax=Pseudomonas fluorescens TaxID=294 RepID=A0A5E6V975_PSEFL|nr:hypothetical protein PS645_03704 [Pseudomonas fluorescens]
MRVSDSWGTNVTLHSQETIVSTDHPQAFSFIQAFRGIILENRQPQCGTSFLACHGENLIDHPGSGTLALKCRQYVQFPDVQSPGVATQAYEPPTFAALHYQQVFPPGPGNVERFVLPAQVVVDVIAQHGLTSERPGKFQRL